MESCTYFVKLSFLSNIFMYVCLYIYVSVCVCLLDKQALYGSQAVCVSTVLREAVQAGRTVCPGEHSNSSCSKKGGETIGLSSQRTLHNTERQWLMLFVIHS